MKKYFEIINLVAPCLFYLQDGSRFDLRTGIPNRAPEVYKSGTFNYLGLKPEAVELFKKETIEALIGMVNRARRVEDVDVLEQCRPKSKALRQACEEKRKQFK